MVSGRRYGDGRPVTLRPVQYTVAPASPSARAIPRPAPRVAPATTATLPVNGLVDAAAGDSGRGIRSSRLLVNGRSFKVTENKRSFIICQAVTPRPRTIDDAGILEAARRPIS